MIDLNIDLNIVLSLPKHPLAKGIGLDLLVYLLSKVWIKWVNNVIKITDENLSNNL